MGKEVMEFVKHLPYETHLHSVQEARDVLCHWRDELPEQIQEQIPDNLDAVRFFEAHVLHEAGYDDINLDCVWIDTPYENEVYFNVDDITFCLRVWPDGIFVRHKGNKRGCIWTDWERVKQ